MSDSGRVIVAAFAGLAALFWAFALGVGVSVSDTQDERYQPYRYTSEQPAQVDATAAGQSQSHAFEYRTPCSDPEGQGESDLCAQWKSANAADDSAFWTKWGFWIGVIGSSLLLWQIILTRQAVEDTGHATAAMNRQNELVEAAQRPWIAIDIQIDQATSTREQLCIEGRLTFKNIGQTAARQFSPRAKVFFSGPDYTNQIVATFNEWKAYLPVTASVLLPGEELVQQCDANGDKRRIPWIEDAQGKRTFCILIAAAFYQPEDQSKTLYTFRPFIAVRSEKGLRFIDLTDDMPSLLTGDKIRAELTGGQFTR